MAAGYLACAVSRTGIVGEFAGSRTPGTEAVLDGFAAGVLKCDAEREIGVKTLGWKPTGNFEQLVEQMVEAELEQLPNRSN